MAGTLYMCGDLHIIMIKILKFYHSGLYHTFYIENHSEASDI